MQSINQVLPNVPRYLPLDFILKNSNNSSREQGAEAAATTVATTTAIVAVTAAATAEAISTSAATAEATTTAIVAEMAAAIAIAMTGAVAAATALATPAATDGKTKLDRRKSGCDIVQTVRRKQYKKHRLFFPPIFSGCYFCDDTHPTRSPPPACPAWLWQQIAPHLSISHFHREAKPTYQTFPLPSLAASIPASKKKQTPAQVWGHVLTHSTQDLGAYGPEYGRIGEKSSCVPRNYSIASSKQAGMMESNVPDRTYRPRILASPTSLHLLTQNLCREKYTLPHSLFLPTMHID